MIFDVLETDFTVIKGTDDIETYFLYVDTCL